MDYQTLRPTIAICFVDTTLFPETPAYHLLFELREHHQHSLLFTDQLAMHILELPKFTKSAGELASPLDRWLYFLRHGEHLDTEALPGTLDVPEIHRALGDLLMMTQSELERERYESRLKMQRDIYTALAEARNEGRLEGRIERVHLLQRLLRRAQTPLEQLRAQPLADLERLANQLEAEVTSSLSKQA
jgi:predicted transposase/invertase (TIGR01784 family)